MRIGIACYPTYGGSGVVASELGRALQRRGHQVHLFSYRVPFKVDQRRDGICFHEVKDPNYPLFEHPSYGMALAAEIAHVAREKGLDVLHAHYAYPHSVSGWLAKAMVRPRPLKIVTTLHGTDITLVGRDARFAPLVKLAIESSDRVTSVSRWLADRTAEIFGTRRRIEVIPNFVDPQAFRPRARRRGPPMLVHVSNFRPVKRPRDAVEVFRRVSKELGTARMLMVGDGPELESTRRYAARLGLGRRIAFLAPRKDVSAVIARAHAMIVTSETESFGLVALEAMACGLPVVATRCGGIEELVREGSTGYLSPVGDIGG
ncbi:MAG TPA: N-acetyl-alpha-D-glucosaminyl L-malate synthase BshA, partial [Planctomycetota bacterium]|nr:N-acetyl-alpha-D-glucosaminyl L-malate synthase BshA [Planctomycetota bacterium]